VRLNTNQRRRKRFRRRRNRDRRWLARASREGICIVTNVRRLERMFGGPVMSTGEWDSIPEQIYSFFKEGGSGLAVEEVVPSEEDFNGES